MIAELESRITELESPPATPPAEAPPPVPPPVPPPLPFEAAAPQPAAPQPVAPLPDAPPAVTPSILIELTKKGYYLEKRVYTDELMEAIAKVPTPKKIFNEYDRHGHIKTTTCACRTLPRLASPRLVSSRLTYASPHLLTSPHLSPLASPLTSPLRIRLLLL